MVDIVGAEARAHHLLHEIGFLVRALGRAEAGERASAVCAAQAHEAGGGAVERLVPTGLAKAARRVGRVDDVAGALRGAGSADQRHRQAVRVARVVEAEAALHAEPRPVGGSVAALRAHDAVVLDVEGELAADAAIGAEAVHRAVRPRRGVGGRQQGAGGARLHALAAGDARRVAHRVSHVEDDARPGAAAGHADHVVDLDFAARAHAAGAVDARVEIHRHRGMADVGFGGLAGGEAAFCPRDRLGPAPQFRVRVMRVGARRLVSKQKFHDHRTCRPGATAVSADCHAIRRPADARRRKRTFPLDLDHAGTTVAVGTIAMPRHMAEVRNCRTEPSRDLPDRFVRRRCGRSPVEGEANRDAHASSSSGKWRSAHSSGFGAAWPRPQIDASAMVSLNSRSNGRSQRSHSINASAFSVPTRQGVH